MVLENEKGVGCEGLGSVGGVTVGVIVTGEGLLTGDAFKSSRGGFVLWGIEFGLEGLVGFFCDMNAKVWVLFV